MNNRRLFNAVILASAVFLIQSCAYNKFYQPLSPAVLAREVPQTTVDLPGIDPSNVKGNRYKLGELNYPAGAVFVSVDSKGFILASDMTKVATALDLKGALPRSAFVFPGVDAVFVLHDPMHGGLAADEYAVHLSRFDLATGKVVWTSTAGVHTLFMWNERFFFDLTTLDVGLQFFKAPYKAELVDGGGSILLCGLTGDPMRPYVRLAKLDLSTGAVKSQELFHAKRDIDERTALFVSFGDRPLVESDNPTEADWWAKPVRAHLKLVDMKAGTTLFNMTIEAQDLPVTLDRIAPVGIAYGGSGSPFLCEVWPILAGNNLLISSRCSSNSGFGNKYVNGPLIMFKLDAETVLPLPNRDLHPAFDIRMQTAWSGRPFVFPDLEPDSHSRLKGLIFLDKDGEPKRLALSSAPKTGNGSIPLVLDERSGGSHWWVGAANAYVLDKDRLIAVSRAEGTAFIPDASTEEAKTARRMIEDVRRAGGIEHRGEMLGSDEYKKSLLERLNAILHERLPADDRFEDRIKIRRLDIRSSEKFGEFLLVPCILNDESAVVAVIGGEPGKKPPDVRALLPVARVRKETLDVRDQYLFWPLPRDGKNEIVTFSNQGRVLIYKLPLTIGGPRKPEEVPGEIQREIIQIK